MQQPRELSRPSLPSLEDRRGSGQQRTQMPWEAKMLYTVETPEGDMISLDEKQLEAFAASAAGAKKTKS